jgi:hypothetical protein
MKNNNLAINIFFAIAIPAVSFAIALSIILVGKLKPEDKPAIAETAPKVEAIAEEEEISVSFSLNHLCKMCTSIKLSQKINVSLSSEYPMLLVYNLGDDSKVTFYVAPKVSD